MQTHGGDAAEAAIISEERIIVAEITVDWNKTGNYGHALSDLSPFVDNIVTDRSLVGTAPAEVMLVEGSSAAELTFTVSGETENEGLSWVAALSPYNGLSPFYNMDILGAEITYRLGVETYLGTVWYSQFIGNLRSISPNRRANTVEITALDRVEKLRRPLFLTDWGVFDYQANLGFFNGQLMHADWVIDHCLKSGQTSTSPMTWGEPEQTAYGTNQIFISGNGGLAPNIGWTDASFWNEFPPDSGPDPSGVVYHDLGQAHPDSPEPTSRPRMFRAQQDDGYDLNAYWAADRDAVNDAYVHVLALTLHTENLEGSQWFTTMADQSIMQWRPTEHRFMHLMMGAGKAWVRIVQDSGTLQGTWDGTKVTIPTTGTHVRVTAEYDVIQKARMTVGATSTGIENVPFSNIGWSFHEYTGELKIHREVSMQDITVGTHKYPTGLAVVNPGEGGVAAKYAAVLDRSMNRLSFLPQRRGAGAWDVITEVAAAEFGAAFWDENGVFHFWNQDTILSKKDSVARYLTLDDVSDLDITVSSDSVRNFAAVTSRRARTQYGLVYEAQGPDEYIAEVVPGDNLKTLWLQDVVTPNAWRPPIFAHPDQTGSVPLDSYPHWSDFVLHGVVEQGLEVDGLWHNHSWTGAVQSVGLWMYRGPQGQTILRYNEGWTNPHRFALSQIFDNNPVADESSSAAFRWGGLKLNTFDDLVFTVKNADSITRWGAQGLELSGDWYQEAFNAAGLVDKILERTADPIPVTDNVTIAGDPRLQLGDTIQVYDPEGLGEALRLQILGIQRTYSRDGGLVDVLTVELVRPPGVGIWDSPQYGLWDSTFIWSD